MLVRIGYDGHPDSWGLVVVAETEAEAAALHAWVRLANNGCFLKIGLAANDFTCPETTQRSRIFRVELLEKKDDNDRVGFKAPERVRTVGEHDPVDPMPAPPEAAA